MAESDGSKQRKEIFEHSYDEVLSVLKHQDDKLNRTLTALAFLTVAGVALFPKLSDESTRFNNAGPEVSALFFVAFLIAVAIGVIVTLTAIGPGRPLPNPPSSSAHHEPEPSLLYYAAISRDPQWEETTFGRPTKDLMETLAKNFHKEAKAISYRVNYKVARIREANAWVQFAIVALALMGIFGVSGLSPSAKWWTATALLTAVIAMPFWDLWMMRDTKYAQGDFSWPAYGILLAIVASAMAFLVTGWATDAEWPALGYAVVAFMTPRYAIIRSQWGIATMIVGLIAAIPTLMLIIFLT